MSNLIQRFEEAIRNATMKWEEYKQKEVEYRGTVNQGLDKLQELIDKLKECIKKLVDLQVDYSSYIQRITQIRINMQTMLDQQITQITNRSGEDCDKKITALLKKFQGFVSQIGEWEGDAKRFEGLLKALDDEIKRLCDKANEIIAKNGENRGGLDEELRKVEEAMGQERGASKEQTADDETKGGETREQQLARLARMEDELERKRQEQEQQTQQPQQRQQRTARGQQRTAQQERDARIAARRENMRARQQQRNTGPSDRFGQGSIYGRGVQSNENYDGSMVRGQGARRGGWQTPQKLESISRYSPIRRVTRKKKNNKKKKKRRKKQTKKRRGKKRN